MNVEKLPVAGGSERLDAETTLLRASRCDDVLQRLRHRAFATVPGMQARENEQFPGDASTHGRSTIGRLRHCLRYALFRAA